MIGHCFAMVRLVVRYQRGYCFVIFLEQAAYNKFTCLVIAAAENAIVQASKTGKIKAGMSTSCFRLC